MLVVGYVRIDRILIRNVMCVEFMTVCCGVVIGLEIFVSIWWISVVGDCGLTILYVIRCVWDDLYQCLTC